MSKQISINEKLFNLQQEIGTISKDAKNPFYKSKYFDINSLINQLQPLLSKYRLSLKQPIKFDAINNLSYIQTYFECADTSQRSDSSEMKIPDVADPQKMGSIITYYRRYTLVSLLSLQAVDDDGNLGSGKVEVNKPTLVRGNPLYASIIEKIKAGTSLSVVKQHYTATKSIWDELAKL